MAQRRLAVPLITQRLQPLMAQAQSLPVGVAEPRLSWNRTSGRAAGDTLGADKSGDGGGVFLFSHGGLGDGNSDFDDDMLDDRLRRRNPVLSVRETT